MQWGTEDNMLYPTQESASCSGGEKEKPLGDIWRRFLHPAERRARCPHAHLRLTHPAAHHLQGSWGTTTTAPQQKADVLEMEHSQRNLNQFSESVMEFKDIFTSIVLSCRWMPRRYGRKSWAARLTTTPYGHFKESPWQLGTGNWSYTDRTLHTHSTCWFPLKGALRICSKTSTCPVMCGCVPYVLNHQQWNSTAARALPKMHTKTCCHTAYFKIPNTIQLPYKLCKYGCFSVKHMKLPVQQRTNCNTCQLSVPNLFSKSKIKNAQKITVMTAENTDSSVSTARSMHLSDL